MNPLKHLYYKHFCKKIFKKYSYYERETFEDRNVLEQIIFPFILAYLEPKKILDIGREDYQNFYNYFFEGRELWTLDYDPKRKEFGAENHITDDAANVADHFKQNYFDFILMNGVFGWGLNDPEKIEKALSGIYNILKPGGIFILGWNDIKDLTPVPLPKIKSLKKFEKFPFNPLDDKTDFKSINGEHTYSFFMKPNLQKTNNN